MGNVSSWIRKEPKDIAQDIWNSGSSKFVEILADYAGLDTGEVEIVKDLWDEVNAQVIDVARDPSQKYFNFYNDEVLKGGSDIFLLMYPWFNQSLPGGNPRKLNVEEVKNVYELMKRRSSKIKDTESYLNRKAEIAFSKIAEKLPGVFTSLTTIFGVTAPNLTILNTALGKTLSYLDGWAKMKYFQMIEQAKKDYQQTNFYLENLQFEENDLYIRLIQQEEFGNPENGSQYSYRNFNTGAPIAMYEWNYVALLRKTNPDFSQKYYKFLKDTLPPAVYSPRYQGLPVIPDGRTQLNSEENRLLSSTFCLDKDFNYIICPDGFKPSGLNRICFDLGSPMWCLEQKKIACYDVNNTPITCPTGFQPSLKPICFDYLGPVYCNEGRKASLPWIGDTPTTTLTPTTTTPTTTTPITTTPTTTTPTTTTPTTTTPTTTTPTTTTPSLPWIGDTPTTTLTPTTTTPTTTTPTTTTPTTTTPTTTTPTTTTPITLTTATPSKHTCLCYNPNVSRDSCSNKGFYR